MKKPAAPSAKPRSAQPKTARRSGARLQFEELEPRLLFSADITALAAAAGATTAGTTSTSTVTSSAQHSMLDATVSAQDEQRVELVFVDRSVADADKLVSGIQQQAQGDDQRKIVVYQLDPQQDGVQQISQVLAGYADGSISALHLITHGQDGSLQIGAGRLDEQTLGAHAADLSGWSRQLKSGADLLLYGCDVAQTAAGQRFVDDLHLLTGADVAASTNLTGNQAQGGDWTLEYQDGAIQSSVVVSAALQQSWQGTLLATAQGSETLVNTTTTGTQSTTSNRQVGIDNSGNFVVVWVDSGSVKGQLFTSAGAASGSQFTVATGTNAQVSMAGNGTFIVSWLNSGTAYYQKYTAAGATSGGTTSLGVTTNLPGIGLSDSGGVASNTQSTNPSVGMNASGTFVLSWTDSASGNIFALRFNSSGVQQGSVITANTTSTGTQDKSCVSMDGSGNFVVVWSSTQGGTEDIYGQRFNSSGTKVGSEFLVNSTTTDVQTSPSVYMDTVTGKFIVAWQSNLQDGSGTGIYMRQYDASGTASSTDQLVNTTTSGAQGTPSVALRNQNAVVVWSGNGTGDSAGVFFQRFNTDQAPVITSNGGGSTASVSVAENTTAVTTVTATDADSDTLTYSIVGGADSAKFSINSSTGVLTFISAPDYENPTDSGANNVYDVTVQASDTWKTVTQAIAVSVTDVSNVLVVTTTADTNDSGLGSSFTVEQLNASKGTDGKVSLREALIAANSTAGTDSITFNIASGSAGTGNDAGAYVITLTSALPTITDAVSIDASTQSGYVVGGLHTVVLDGADLASYGLQLTNTSDGTTIRGLVIRNFASYGIYMPTGSDSQTIVGNYIGSFYADGSNKGTGTGNATAGIWSQGANAVIGGTTAADRNVISGNSGGYDIYLTTGSNGTVVQGNYIGTNAAGTSIFSTTNPDYGIMVETSASNITIGGSAAGAGNVVSGHNREGMWITTTGTVTVQGNYIGTDYTGSVDLGNTRYGVYLDDAGTASIIGNVISGNNLGGIYAGNAGVTVTGNIIGLNAAGTAALGNTGSGIELRTTAASTIGGNTAAARNVISGNSNYGIDIETNYAHVIKGNYIGLALDGSTLLGNGSHGIYVNTGNQTIGGKNSGDGNTIAGNGGAGIDVATGTGTLYYRNSIYSNTGIGIDLGGDGVTVNDYGDGDGGANWLNNYAVISSAVVNGTSTTITGSIDWYAHSTADTIYIELYASPTLDPTGYGEGKTYVGYVIVTTDPTTGDATFSTTVTGVSAGDYITAVANIETSNIGGSEFSPGLAATTVINAPKGKLIWTDNDQLDSWVANWTGSAFSAAGMTGLNLGDDVTMMAVAEAPTRNEFIMIGSADVSGKIEAIVWNGTSWSAPLGIPVASPSAAASQYNSFAVAYESQSGDAMLVWDNGGTGTTGLSYAVWNGTAWSSINTITAPASGEPLQMKLVSNPVADGMVLVATTNTGNNNYAIVWNGSSWGNSQTLGTNSNKQYFEINAAYESKTGNAVVVYDNSSSDSSSLQYRTWNGSAWSSEGTIAAPSGITAASDVYCTAIASDPTSNRIAIAVKDAVNEVWLAVWDGSTWGNKLAATTSGIDAPDHHATMAVAFESLSGDLLAVYGKSAGPNVYYRTWTSSGGWSSEGTGPSNGGTDIVYATKLWSDPYSNAIMMGVQDGGLDLNMTQWDGSAWGTTTTVDSNTGEYYRENFAYAWNVYAPPSITNLASDTLAYTEKAAASVIDQSTAAVATDGDGVGWSGGNLTVLFTAGSTSTEDVLGIRNQGTSAGQIGVSGGNVTYGGTVIGSYTGGSSGASLVITLNAAATNAAVSALVNNITYVNTNTTNPSTTSRTVRYTTTNARGMSSANYDTTVTVTAVNDAPTATITPTTYSATEQTSLTLHGTGLSIADVDAGSSVVQATLSVVSGTLTVTAGTTGVTVTNSGTSTVTLSGTLTQINNLLAGNLGGTATYVINSDTPPASDTLTLTASDLGNTGTGGTLTASDTATINITAVNDAPTATITPTTYSATEQTSLTLHGTGLSIADVDAGSSTVQATLSVVSGTLTVAAGTTGVTVTNSGTSSVTLSGTLTQINNLLAGNLGGTATYVINSDTPPASDTLTLTASDLGNTGTGGTLTASDTATINITAVNDAPTATITPTTYSATEQTSLTLHGTGLSIADVDAGSSTVQATLSVTSGTLTVGAGTTGVTVTNSGTSTVTLSGTLTQINNLLAGSLSGTVTYLINSDTPPASDTLTLTASDLGNTGTGGTLTASDTATINITAVNDAPTATITPTTYSATEQTSLTLHGTGLSIADVDAGSSTVQATLSVVSGTLTVGAGTTGVTVTNSGTSTVTLSGTLTQINNLLAGNLGGTATYVINSDTPPASDTLTLTASDLGNTGTGGTLTASDTATINITAVNDAPTATITPTTYSATEQTSLTLHGTGLSIADVDAGSSTVQATLSVVSGTLTVAAGTTAVTVTNSGTSTVTLSGTLTQINNLLAGNLGGTATYVINSDTPPASDTLTLTASDLGNTGTGGTLTASDTATINITAVNDAPTATITPTTYSATEQTSLTLHGTGLSIADVDAGSSTVQATLSVVSGTLSVGAGTTGVTVTNSGTSTVTLSGTLTQINNLLAGNLGGTATYVINSDTPPASDTLTLTASDLGNTGTGGTLTASDTATINITAVNDAPTATITPTTYSATEQTSLTLHGTGLSIADVDAGSSTVQATLSVVSGTLTVAAGTTGVTVTNSGTSSVTLSGTLTQINNLLAGNLGGTATYVINSDTPPASDTLTLTASDLGNTGTGGTLTASDTATINITAVNDAPTATITPTTYSATEQTSLTLHGTGLSIADVDAGSSTVQATLSVVSGTLTMGAGTTGVTVTNSGTSTVTLSGTLTQINNLLAGNLGGTATYVINSDTPPASDTLTLTASDLGNTGTGGTLTASDTATINITAVNDAPTATITPTTYSATEQTSLTLHGTGLSISDVDAGSSTVQATLSVVSGTLTVTAGTTGVTVTNSGTSTVTLSGTLTQINNLLAGNLGGTATYVINSDTPPASDTLTLTASDLGNTGTGGTLTASDTATINITAVNDAPTATITQGSYSATEQVAKALQGTGLSIADADASSSSVKVTLSASAGTFSAAVGTTGVTLTNNGTTSVTLTGTLTQINNLLAGNLGGTLTYTVTSDTPPATDTITMLVNDQGNTGSGGAKTGSASVTVNITAVNDAPVANNDTASTNLGTPVNVAVKANDSDPDNTVASLTVTIVSSSAGTTASVKPDGTIDFDPGATTGAQTVVYYLTDSGGLTSGNATLTINVAANTPPTGTDKTVSTSEDTSHALQASDFGFADTDLGQTFAGIQIDTLPGLGNLKLNGVAVLAGDFVSSADIGSGLLVFTPAADGNGVGYTSFTFKVQDNLGAFSAAANTLTIDVSAVNDAPVNTVPGPGDQSTAEDTALVFSSGNGNLISISDVDAGSGNMQVTLGVSNGILTLSGTTNLTFNSGANGSASMVFTGTISDINAALAGMSYTPGANFNGTDTLTMSTSDLGNTGSGGPLSDSSSVIIDVTPVNDAPTATITPATYSATEQTSLTLHGTGLSIADVDAGSSTVQATLSVTSGTLTVGAGTTGVTVTNSGTSTVTLSGTLTQINNLLAGNLGGTATYVINSDTPPASDTLTLAVNDLGNTGAGGALTASDTATINITAVNDAPTTTITQVSYSASEQTSLTLHGTGLSIADVDAGSGTVQATLSVTSGTLTVGAGTTGVTVTNSGTSTVTLSGTLTQINNLLAGNLGGTATYVINSDTPPATDTLVLAVDDLGNTGSGGAQTASSNVTINITAVNDAPTATITPTTYSATEQTSLTLHGTGLSIADVDAGSGTVQATLSVTSGTLTVGAGTTGVTVTNSGTSSVTLSGTITQINNLLAGNLGGTATYVINSDTPPASDTLTLAVNDLGNTGTGGVLKANDTATINITAVNDAPTTTITQVSYSASEQTSLTLHGTGLSVADVDAGSGTVQATLSVTSGTLTVGAGTTGVTVTNSGTSSVTLSGTLTQINNLLAGNLGGTATYVINSDTPPATDTLVLAVDDLGNTGSGGAQTASSNVTINITAVNDAPTATITPTTYSATEQTSLTLHGTGLSIADVDAGSSTVQATLSVVSGTLTVTAGTTGVTVTNSGTSTVTLSGTITQINNLLAGNLGGTATYVINSDTPSASDTLTLAVNDLGNTGTGGVLKANDTATINITAVNDAPTATITQVSYSASEQTSLTLHGTGLSLADVDAGSGTVQATLSVTSGTLTVGAGTTGVTVTNSGTSSVTLSGTLTQINNLLAGNLGGTATYVINSDTPPATDTLVLAVDDQGNTGSGGAQTASSNVTINITAVNDAPTATITPTTYSATEQTSLTLHGTGLSIADVDAGSSVVQATLSVVSGTLTVTAGTTGVTVTNSGTSTVTLSGTLTQINNLLTGNLGGTATYVINSDTPPASDTLTLTVSDLGNTGTGGTLTASDTATINITAVNDAPTATITPTTYSATEQTSLTLHGTGLSIADVDAGSSTVQATLSVVSGTLTVGAGTTGVTVTNSGTSSVTLSGTITQINNLLAGISGGTARYLINSDTPPASDTLTLAVNDLGSTGTGGALTASDTATINITAVNDAPTATITPTTYSATEQTSLTLHGTGLSIADVDAGSSAVQATLSVVSGTLTVTAGTTGVTVTNSGTSTVTLSGTITQINNLLAGNLGGTATYVINSDTPPASDTLTLTVSDLGNTGTGGTLTASDTATINITAVNDAPTATITPTTYSATEQTSLTLHGTGLSIADVDAGSSTVQATLSVVSGTLTVGAGTTGVTVTNSGTSSVTLSGTLTQINNLLAGNGASAITYILNSDAPPATDTLTLTARDMGNTGTGGTLTGSDTATINITAVNDAPSAVVPSGLSAPESSNLELAGTGMAIADPDAGSTPMQVTLSATGGTLTVAAGSTGVTIGGSGSNSVTLDGTLAQINNLLAGAGAGSILYANPNAAPASDTLVLVVNDLGGGGTGGALTSLLISTQN